MDSSKWIRKNKKILFAIAITTGAILLYVGITTANTLLAAIGIFIVSVSIYLR